MGKTDTVTKDYTNNCEIMADDFSPSHSHDRLLALLRTLSPANMLDEEIDRFVTSLREVMLCVKYGKDDARLTYMFQNDKRFKNIDSDAREVINKLIGTEIEVERKEPGEREEYQVKVKLSGK